MRKRTMLTLMFGLLLAPLAATSASAFSYQAAKTGCTSGTRVVCTVMQPYCVTNTQTVQDTCPGDSVRNKQGKCVKEDEPVQANRCSGGRLLSQSRQVCHCPDSAPVWTGQQCISSKPVAGPTNSQIQQRCRLLAQECKSDLQGACRALREYCDRG
jgi:hypothetical protein